MKVTLNQIRLMEAPMQRLGAIHTLPCRTTYQVCMLMRKLSEHGGPAKQANDAAVRKYGKQDDKGNFTVTEENTPAFIKEMQDLFLQEVEIEFEPIAIPGDTKGLSAQDLMILDPFVTVQEAPPALKIEGRPAHGKGSNKDVA